MKTMSKLSFSFQPHGEAGVYPCKQGSVTAFLVGVLDGADHLDQFIVGNLVVVAAPYLAQRWNLHHADAVELQQFADVHAPLVVASYGLAFGGCTLFAVPKGQVPVRLDEPSRLDVHGEVFALHVGDGTLSADRVDELRQFDGLDGDLAGLHVDERIAVPVHVGVDADDVFLRVVHIAMLYCAYRLPLGP